MVRGSPICPELRLERHVVTIIPLLTELCSLRSLSSINILLLTELQALICASIFSRASGSSRNPAKTFSASAPIGGSIVSA
jgi:hypothetical protein